MIDQRTMDKYEKEAKEQSRDSWYLSWALDTNKEERAKVFFFIINRIMMCDVSFLILFHFAGKNS